jgi:hypothetical protein
MVSRSNGTAGHHRRLNRLGPMLRKMAHLPAGRLLSPGDHKKVSAAPHSNPVARVSVP